MLKIVSITNDPVRIPATAGPRNETTGSRPPRTAWRKITRASEAPLARAVRMKSWLSTSSMPPRGKHAVARKVPTRGVELLQVQRENEHEQRPHDERRHADPDHRRGRGEIIE